MRAARAAQRAFSRARAESWRHGSLASVLQDASGSRTTPEEVSLDATSSRTHGGTLPTPHEILAFETPHRPPEKEAPRDGGVEPRRPRQPIKHERRAAGGPRPVGQPKDHAAAHPHGPGRRRGRRGRARLREPRRVLVRGQRVLLVANIKLTALRADDAGPRNWNRPGCARQRARVSMRGRHCIKLRAVCWSRRLRRGDRRLRRLGLYAMPRGLDERPIIVRGLRRDAGLFRGYGRVYVPSE